MKINFCAYIITLINPLLTCVVSNVIKMDDCYVAVVAFPTPLVSE